MNNLPLVTVYITNFNYANYIKESFESVKNQTYSNIEVLIIDDGSTDTSLDIIKDIEKKNSEVKTIFQQNKGLNKTNNVALEASNGDYIMRLDADDILLPEAVETLVKELDNNDDVGLVFPDYFLMDEKGNKYSVHKRYNFDTDVTLFDRPAHGACTMIRTECLRAVGGYDEDFSCQDG